MIEVTIESLSHEGRGIAHHNGKTIFIENALPNERVQIEYTKRHPRYDEAHVVNIIDPSPHRVVPRCQHFSICGGCDLQHLHPDQQLQLKQQTLLEQFKHFGNLHPDEILPPLHSPSWGYRHKARLSVKYVLKKQKLLIGFHEKNGRYVADLSRCEVLHPSVGLKLEALRDLIGNLSIYNKIAQIEVAIDDTTTALIFRHLVEIPEADQKALLAFAQTHNIHLYLHPNKPQTITRLWPSSGDEKLQYQISDNQITIAFRPTDFTQINPFINKQMIAQALGLLELKAHESVLDLFCGLGNFTLPIARHCKTVTGVDGDNRLMEDAKDNAKLNNLDNVEFFAANLFEPHAGLPWLHQKFDKILLDPPRSGALEIIQEFPRWRPARIVYVSCNPATLARDAGELVNKQGYRLVKAGIMDMFPHTKHVESMALFIPR